MCIYEVWSHPTLTCLGQQSWSRRIPQKVVHSIITSTSVATELLFHFWEELVVRGCQICRIGWVFDKLEFTFLNNNHGHCGHVCWSFNTVTYEVHTPHTRCNQYNIYLNIQTKVMYIIILTYYFNIIVINSLEKIPLI